MCDIVKDITTTSQYLYLYFSISWITTIGKEGKVLGKFQPEYL